MRRDGLKPLGLIMRLYDVCLAIGESGGATLKQKNGVFELLKRKQGFAVSLFGYEKTFTYKDVDTLYDNIIHYINDNESILSQKNKCLGVWVDNGIVYLDITIIISNKVVALLRGRLERQKAIFDFNNSGSLYIEDYKHIIDNVILYEKVNNVENVEALRYFRTEHSKQLNHCNAYLVYDKDNFERVYAYYSYNTIIFIQIGSVLYFNRLCYSSTTSQHVHKFIKRYNLKALEWLQLEATAWSGLLRQLRLYSQYEPRSSYTDNGLSWLIDVNTITQ